MGRYYFDAKKTVEQSTELSIFWLNGEGLLNGYCITTITWTRKLSGSKSSAGLEIDISGEHPYMRMTYTITRYRDGSTEDYDYRIQLVKTRCNLGGVRYWFLCPRCGRRVGKLYRRPLGEMYLCRTWRGRPTRKMQRIAKLEQKDRTITNYPKWFKQHPERCPF